MDDAFAHDLIVFDETYHPFVKRHWTTPFVAIGMVSVTEVPPDAGYSTTIWPPMSATSRLMVQRPRPPAVERGRRAGVGRSERLPRAAADQALGQ